jgi:hypothetical protein
MTLSELKQAIDAIPAMPQPEQYPAGNGYWDAMHDYQDLRFEAAMAAFEWRDSIEFANVDPGSYTEGMRLIAEKLR